MLAYEASLVRTGSEDLHDQEQIPQTRICEGSIWLIDP
jgi:hypothetical protein